MQEFHFTMHTRLKVEWLLVKLIFWILSAKFDGISNLVVDDWFKQFSWLIICNLFLVVWMKKTLNYVSAHKA